MSTKIYIKRIYEEYEKSDGYRVLVDRLWPRGVSKKDTHIDLWAKEVTPSSELRKWLHEKPDERHDQFVAKYKQELQQNPQFVEFIGRLSDENRVTLLSSVKNIEASHVPVLRKEINAALG